MVKVETEAPALGRKPSATATPSTLDKRASPRLYRLIRNNLHFNTRALRGPCVAPRPVLNLLLAGQRGL